MKPADNGFIFSTGRQCSANNNIIGINPELDVSDGYDGGFSIVDEEDAWEKTLTTEERTELADYMIGLWTAYRKASPPHP